jgi:hypothetical protein
MKKNLLYSCFILITLIFIGCGGGGDSSPSEEETVPSSTLTGESLDLPEDAVVNNRSCILDYTNKLDISEGISMCVNNYPASECWAQQSETTEAYVDVYQVANSCQDLGFDASTLFEHQDSLGNTYNAYLNTNSAYSPYLHANTEDLFPVVDTQSLVENPPSKKVLTEDVDAIVNLTLSPQAVVINSDDVKEENESKISLNALPENIEVGKPIFIDDTFKGIAKVIDGNDIEVGEADTIADIYDQFDLDMNVDNIKQSLSRAIRDGSIKGKYDDINSDPLKISVIENKNRSNSEDKLSLKVEFPENYKVPVDLRGLNCSFYSGECSFTLDGVIDKTIPLEVSTDSEKAYIFTTKGSSIEIGLGTYLKLYYNKNLVSKDEFAFTYAQSAAFKSTLSFKLSATPTDLTSDVFSWEGNFNPIGDFEVEILHPKSHLVKTSVIVAPTITLGINGKLSGTVTYKTGMERSGEIRVKYDSRDNTSGITNTIKDNAGKLDDDQFGVELEASVSAYCFPNMTFVPNVKPIRTKYAVTLFEVRAGAKLNNTLSGKIGKNFVATNDGILENDSGEVKVLTALSGLAQGKWSVKFGAKGGEYSFYESESFTDIFETTPKEILEWKMNILPNPIIEIENDPEDENKKLVSFDINVDDSIKEKIKFYYHISTDLSTTNTILTDQLSNYLSTTSKAQPLEVDENVLIQVIAVLNNADVSESYWKFGQSISKEVSEKVVNIINPTFNPADNTVFTDEISVDLSQSQNYDIYYAVDNGTYQLYTNSINLTDTSTIEAYTATTIDSVKITSETVTATYTKCEDNEIVQNNQCVACKNDEVVKDGVCTKCAEGETIVDGECKSSSNTFYKPSQNACIDGGGSISYYNECEANYFQAQTICELPSIQEWEDQMLACGAVIDDMTANENNTYYQACISALGYISGRNSFYYWSSTPLNDYNTNYAHTGVGYTGTSRYNYSSFTFVRCKSGGLN